MRPRSSFVMLKKASRLTNCCLISAAFVYVAYHHPTFVRWFSGDPHQTAFPSMLAGLSPPAQPSPPQTNQHPMNKPIHSRYGGVLPGALHLGGWSLQTDIGGISNNTFNFMMGILGIKSVLDIGCGRGISTKYFHDKGATVLCVEGSHEAVTHSLLPAARIVEHDYTLGPWWPNRTYDACWSVEFLEHVSRQYAANYMASFRRCALIFASRSRWGGHHHVEVHPEWWWVTRFRMRGFVFDRELTDVVRRQATIDQNAAYQRSGNKTQLGQHIRLTMMVFVNPSVAALAAHDHLMSGHGCYDGVYDNAEGGKRCINDTLSPAYSPLMHCTKPKSGGEVDDRYALWQCH